MESERHGCLVAAWGAEAGVADAVTVLGTCQLVVKDRLFVLQLRGTVCLLSQGCQMQAGFCTQNSKVGDKVKMQIWLARSEPMPTWQGH